MKDTEFECMEHGWRSTYQVCPFCMIMVLESDLKDEKDAHAATIEATDILVSVDKLLSEHGFCEMASTRHQLSIAISLHNQSLKQARREGWEQGKKEAIGKVNFLYENSFGAREMLSVAADAIAAMEYGESK